MPVDVSQLEQQLEGKTKELSVLQARISELENELKTVEQLKAQLTDQTQKLSTSERRVAELERLQDAQTASVKTVEGLTNQFGQKTKEIPASKGRFSDVEKGLNGALATSQANIKLAQDAWAASQKLGDKVKDLIGQVSGLKSALVIVDEGSQAVTEEEQNPDLSVRCLQDQVQKLTASYSELHANAEHCVAFLNDYTGCRLTIDSWVKALHLAISPIEGDVNKSDRVTEFWRIQDTWGNGRSTYSQNSAGTLHSCLSLYAVLVSRPDGMDWMNLALLHASNLLADMLAEPQKIYRGLLVEITNMVVRMVKEHILHQNDPLLLSVWQILTYANAMTQRSLAVAMVSLVEVIGGQLTKLVTAITSGPSDVQALCEQEESGMYYNVSQVGVLLDRDMGTNERWYILLNFAAQNLQIRVVVGKRWKFVLVERSSIQFTGNDEDTTYTFEIDRGGPWWIASK